MHLGERSRKARQHNTRGVKVVVLVMGMGIGIVMIVAIVIVIGMWVGHTVMKEAK